MKQLLGVVMAMVTLAALGANPVVHVQKQGVERTIVTLETTGTSSGAKSFNEILKRNLERSGAFKVAPNGQIRVTGTPGATVQAVGKGKQMSMPTAFSSDAEARMAARRFSDEMVKNYTDGGKGFAQNRIAFVNRKGADNAELYMCYPDGYDIRQLTSDGHACVGPRWAPNKRDIYYTGFLQKTPLVYRLDSTTGARKLLAQFKGLATGGAVAPDGKRCAIILSYQGNPELYVLDFATTTVQRMTRTPAATEASPCWSPDGTKIAYVSDESRQPQIYIVDVASKSKKRFTAKGIQNTDPDWSEDGKLTWCSKRAGQNLIMVADVNAGEASAKAVTAPGTWEHPSWAGDGRHLVASRDKALFIVDTAEEENQPVRIFANAGNWMNPSVAR